MRKAEVEKVPTIYEIVHRATEVCDPDGRDGAGDLLARFEDRDDPVGEPAVVEQEIAEAKGAIDPQDEDPVVVMTAAVATYLAYKRTEVGRDREELLVLAARAEFDGNPPENVARWLDEQGVQP